ncbi:hypothetical protein FOCC_FOCC009435 [Frankliniella occidentalis]|nr:hypothetical protein FOCC_FOCC009435 [Frankliniella occidentalis]
MFSSSTIMVHCLWCQHYLSNLIYSSKEQIIVSKVKFTWYHFQHLNTQNTNKIKHEMVTAFMLKIIPCLFCIFSDHFFGSCEHLLCL